MEIYLSFEPGLSAESVSDQVYDDSRSGLLSGFTQPASVGKKYTDDIQLQSKEVFNYDDYFESNDDIYGGYN